MYDDCIVPHISKNATAPTRLKYSEANNKTPACKVLTASQLNWNALGTVGIGELPKAPAKLIPSGYYLTYALPYQRENNLSDFLLVLFKLRPGMQLVPNPAVDNVPCVRKIFDVRPYPINNGNLPSAPSGAQFSDSYPFIGALTKTKEGALQTIKGENTHYVCQCKTLCNDMNQCPGMIYMRIQRLTHMTPESFSECCLGPLEANSQFGHTPTFPVPTNHKGKFVSTTAMYNKAAVVVLIQRLINQYKDKQTAQPRKRPKTLESSSRSSSGSLSSNRSSSNRSSSSNSSSSTSDEEGNKPGKANTAQKTQNTTSEVVTAAAKSEQKSDDKLCEYEKIIQQKIKQNRCVLQQLGIINQ